MDRPNLSKMTRDELDAYALDTFTIDTTELATKADVVEAIEAKWKEEDAAAAAAASNDPPEPTGEPETAVVEEQAQIQPADLSPVPSAPVAADPDLPPASRVHRKW